MNVSDTQTGQRFTASVFAVGACLLILPASLFLAAAILRGLQPSQYQPARLSWQVFDWFASHLTAGGAGVIFLALPSAVLLAGCGMLLWNWFHDESLRSDLRASFGILRRNFGFGVLALATSLGGVILAAVVAHLIAG